MPSGSPSPANTCNSPRTPKRCTNWTSSTTSSDSCPRSAWRWAPAGSAPRRQTPRWPSGSPATCAPCTTSCKASATSPSAPAAAGLGAAGSGSGDSTAPGGFRRVRWPGQLPRPRLVNDPPTAEKGQLMADHASVRVAGGDGAASVTSSAANRAELDAVVRAVLAVSSGLDLTATLQQIVEAVAGLVDARYAALAVRGRVWQVDRAVYTGVD